MNHLPDGYTAPTYNPPHIDNWGDYKKMAYGDYPAIVTDRLQVNDRPFMSISLAHCGPGHDLLPWKAIGAIAAMMHEMTSTGRHGKDDWRRMPSGVHISHADIHMDKFANGDTSEDHILHAACRLLMALDQRLTHDTPGFSVETDHVRTDVRVFDDDGAAD